MTVEVSIVRLYLMRLVFLLILIKLGIDVWPDLISRGENWDPMVGVAYSFWGALTVLSILGLRCPLKMLPVLLMQFTYKIIWIVSVAIPQWSAIKSSDLAFAMLLGVAIDLVVIPWPYVFKVYIRQKSERWKLSS